MNESEFQTVADETIEVIQDAIDECGADIDYDEIGGVLTLEFENGSKIIFGFVIIYHVPHRHINLIPLHNALSFPSGVLKVSKLH